MICPHCGRDTDDPTPDQVIERFYRSRLHGSRVTLRQLAADSPYSYAYLCQAKVQYDAAGKWGSKKKLSPRTGYARARKKV